MGIQPTTVSHETSTPIPLVDDNGTHLQGPARIWNPLDSGANLRVHLGGDAGTDADVVLAPGSGHPFDASIASVECLGLGAAPMVIQLLTGTDAGQENIATLTGIEVDVDLDASAANTARTTATLVLPVQHVDAAGKVQPAGDDPARPVHVASVGPTTGAETLYAEQTGNGESQAALAANALRKKATIANAATSTTPLWIGQGVAAEANKGIRVDPGGAYNWDALNPFLGVINVYAAATATWSRSES